MKHVCLSIFALQVLGCELFGCLVSSLASAQPRPRVIVLTDYFKDPDDKQSMIRLFSMSNELEIEGLVATSLAYGDGAVHPEWLVDLIRAYAEVLPNLRKHERQDRSYPTAAALEQVVVAGAPIVRRLTGKNKGFAVPWPEGARDSRSCEPAEKWIGSDKSTAASEHIIKVVDRADPRPVWIVVWGGGIDLAQALWKVRHERSAAQTAHFVEKLRVYQISWQDTGSVWIWNNFPDLFLIQNSSAQRGIHLEGPPSGRDLSWVHTNISQHHGRLGAEYPQANVPGIKEGDSPSFLYLLAGGLSDPEFPTWGGWGGRFQKLDEARNFYVQTEDQHPDSLDPDRRAMWTIGRWNVATSNDFAARMDWCVQDYAAANHHPRVLIDGDLSTRVLEREVEAGQRTSLDATGSSDPDGNSLTYRWWHYGEVGVRQQAIDLNHANTVKVEFMAPPAEQSCSFHIILEVTDDGFPPLTSYRRVLVTVKPRQAN